MIDNCAFEKKIFLNVVFTRHICITYLVNIVSVRQFATLKFLSFHKHLSDSAMSQVPYWMAKFVPSMEPGPQSLAGLIEITF